MLLGALVQGHCCHSEQSDLRFFASLKLLEVDLAGGQGCPSEKRAGTGVATLHCAGWSAAGSARAAVPAPQPLPAISAVIPTGSLGRRELSIWTSPHTPEAGTQPRGRGASV